MLNSKSVVFVVCIISICGVLGKIKVSKALQPPVDSGEIGSTSPSGKIEVKADVTPSTEEKIATVNVLEEVSDKPSPLDSEITTFKNLIANSKGERQQLYGGLLPQNFGQYVVDELQRADRNGNGLIDIEEYKGRLEDIAQRYFISVEEFANDSVEALFNTINKNNEGQSKDALDEREFSEFVLFSLETLVKKLEAINDTPLEKVFNLRAYLDDIKPESHFFPCNMIKNNNDAAEYIKQKVYRIPLKAEILNELLSNLSGTTARTCQEIQKEIGDRTKILTKYLSDDLIKLSASLNVDVNRPMNVQSFMKVHNRKVRHRSYDPRIHNHNIPPYRNYHA